MKLLSTVRLTDSQKRVIAKIAAAPTPNVAATDISKDANLVAARNMLMQLGAITYSEQEAQLTDKGQQLGVAENIIDDSGQLTDVGTKMASTESNGLPTPGAEPGSAAPEGGMDVGMSDPSTAPPQNSDDMSLESFALLKELLG
jgi:hypothetical protein